MEQLEQQMKRVVGVRFKEVGRMYYFDPGELEINEGDGAIVETSRGTEFADVIMAPREIPEAQIVAPLKNVLRVATPEDWQMRKESAAKEKEAFDICNEKIRQHELDMKLVDVEYTFNGSKVTFFFTAEGRVDFRELVKDLAYVFKTRIELRQIGVRDEAKMLGGLGSCGRPVCCKTFLDDFQPVSIKMAKEQNLSLSPTKISGLCGRLMCCLKYEQDAYEQMRKVMPKVNKEIMTPDGRGIVQENNVITEKTKVRIALPDGTFDVREYHFSTVHKPAPGEEGEAFQPPKPKEDQSAAEPQQQEKNESQPQQKPAQQREHRNKERSHHQKEGGHGQDKQRDGKERPKHPEGQREGRRQGKGGIEGKKPVHKEQNPAEQKDENKEPRKEGQQEHRSRNRRNFRRRHNGNHRPNKPAEQAGGAAHSNPAPSGE